MVKSDYLLDFTQKDVKFKRVAIIKYNMVTSWQILLIHMVRKTRQI